MVYYGIFKFLPWMTRISMIYHHASFPLPAVHARGAQLQRETPGVCWSKRTHSIRWVGALARQEIERKIEERFKWQDWEEGRFVECRVLVEEQPDGSYWLIPPFTAWLFGQLQWNQYQCQPAKRPEGHDHWAGENTVQSNSWGLELASQQVSPHTSSEVGLMLSEICNSTVETIFHVNKLL